MQQGAVCWLEGSDNEEEVLPDAVLVFALPAPGVSHPAGDDVVFGLGFERLEFVLPGRRLAGFPVPRRRRRRRARERPAGAGLRASTSLHRQA